MEGPHPGPAPPSPPAPAVAATLQDVARLAGVSAKTVARALNGEPNVRDATRERVARAAAALRFRPNRLARELRQGARTGAVGLVIGGLENPFYSHLAAGVERALRAEDLELVIASTDDDPERERAVVQTMLERRVRALLVVPVAEDHRYLEGERSAGTPLVFVDRPPTGLAADVVLWDNRTGVRQAVDALVAAGHRRIAVIADRIANFTARERLAAFREAARAHGLGLEPRLLVVDVHDVPAARATALRLLAAPEPPTAFFGLNNRITVGVVAALLTTGGAQAVVGFDDFDLAEALGTTVVANDPAAMGGRAGRLALARLAAGPGLPEQVLLPATLVRRGSGERGPAAAAPSRAAAALA
ncbi:LacI family transcriptional regulator [Vallicoccus soli]|uniref:LacI family transcriptional regulator n=1 Tax=Vallicoccus soli TaxID=2339232 RepID=A0A3A3Z707_9ACTN|nr:LacI family transcriptional regulator [Vallicoccus soli]